MILVLVSIVLSTFLITIFARGYIPEYDNGIKIKATGILSATSIPKNANVVINDKLYSTTDDAINLVPGDYQLKIIKEGYLPWNKKVTIQKELVTKAEASLFKTNPKLLKLSSSEIINPTINSDFSKIVYILPTATASFKPGIYLAETNYYLSLVSNQLLPKLITQNPFSPLDTTVTFTYSPNSKQILAKSTLKQSSYLIDLSISDPNQNITQINPQNEKVKQDWLLQSTTTEKFNRDKLPNIFTNKIATIPASIQFSSDENMILYNINDNYFVYDIEKNLYFVLENIKQHQYPFWLPKSNSIIYTNNNEIKSIEYDGSNHNTIFISDFKFNSVNPQYDGEKLNITTQNSIYQLTIR